MDVNKQESVENVVRSLVDAGQLAAAAALPWRNDELVLFGAARYRDLASGCQVERDTIFRKLELSQMARGIGLGAWSAIASFHTIATS